jgi:hypothetical protein
MTFAQFKDSVDAANLKHIDDIKRELTYPLDSAHIVSISEKNNSFYPLNNIENNYKDVFALAIANPELKDSTYTDVELEQLRAIASLCPYKEGNSVYLARVILHGFENKEYINNCEIVSPPSNNQRIANFEEEENPALKKLESTSNYENLFSIFPNPNNGRFSLSCPINSSFNFELISSIGQIVKSGNIKNANGNIDINCSDFSKGIYQLKINGKEFNKVFRVSINK